MPELLSYQEEGPVLVVRLERPESGNVLSRQLQGELLSAWEHLESEDRLLAAVVHGGENVFSVGHDVPELLSAADDPSMAVPVEGMFPHILSKPVIAAVEGGCYGLGFELALACDLRVGSENTRFKTVFIERSLSPDSGMSYFLPRIVGASRAFDLVFTSRMVDADEAYRIGLLDRMTTTDQLMEDAKALAREIAFWPPVAMQMSKRVLQHSTESSLEEQLLHERRGLIYSRRAPHDVEEAAASFRERRPPNFTGH